MRVTLGVEGEFKIEANPYVSIRLSVLISALLVALSYGLVRRDPRLGQAWTSSLRRTSRSPLSLFFIGLFAMVSRRTALNQVVGLLIIENGLFLFTTALTQGVSLIIEVGILGRRPGRGDDLRHAPARMSQTFDTFDMASLEKLKDD